jgi:pimeloyl-ACP methyl ester carboxylesterase
MNATDRTMRIRGEGPVVLMLTGATPASLFDDVVVLLAREFSVVTWEQDRPARLTAPAGVSGCAEEAGGRIERLSAGPVALYGFNGGASTALELALSRPHLLRGAVLHDVPLLRVLTDPGHALDQLDQALSLAGAGHEVMRQAYLRAQEPALWDKPSGVRRRLVGARGRFVPAEVEALAGYLPDAAALAASSVPFLLVSGTRTPAHYEEVNRWIAARCGAPAARVAGGHWSFLEDPAAFVAVIRPFLRGISTGPAVSSRAHGA